MSTQTARISLGASRGLYGGEIAHLFFIDFLLLLISSSPGSDNLLSYLRDTLLPYCRGLTSLLYQLSQSFTLGELSQQSQTVLFLIDLAKLVQLLILFFTVRLLQSEVASS